MEQKYSSLIYKLIIGSILAVSWITPASAQQDLLTRAEVYKLINQVQLMLNGKPPRRAVRKDVLVPLDELQTRTKSGAELLFNEGSLARIGSSAKFRFKPGLRRFNLDTGIVKAETIFELRNGTAVVMTPSGSTGTTIETPENRIDLIASALPPGTETLPPTTTDGAVAITYNSATKIGQVFNLTNLPVKVANLDGTQFKILQAGQTVTMTNGVIGPVQTFDLQKFYQTSKLAAGLGPGQEGLVAQESANVQLILNKIRKQTLAGLETQKLWIEGLCNLNSRGGASTLSTNCITTGTDDPIRDFEDNREPVTPPPDPPKPVDPGPEDPGKDRDPTRGGTTPSTQQQ